MAEIFDMLGDPIGPNHGRRGRPLHVATLRNISIVSELERRGATKAEMAKALSITKPTLLKHYFAGKKQ